MLGRVQAISTDLHRATTQQLLTCARDALTIAGRHPTLRQVTGQYVDADAALGTLTQTAEALSCAIDELSRAITTQHETGRTTAVDGPFAGDAGDAVAAANLWLGKGRQATEELTHSIVNAHIAASGLAVDNRAS